MLVAIAALAVVLDLAFSPPPVRADHLPPTLSVEPGEGKRGTVVAVSGENCEFGGKAMQHAGIYFFDGSGKASTRFYKVESDGSWAGEFWIPHWVAQTATVSVSCYADDMVAAGPERKFRVLVAEPASMTHTPATASPGGQVNISGLECVADQRRPLTTVAVYLTKVTPPKERTPAPSLPPPMFQGPVDSGGAWQGALTVPASMEPGDYEMWARCTDASTILETARQPFTVTPKSPTMTNPSVKAATTPSPTTTSSSDVPAAPTEPTVAAGDEAGEVAAPRAPRSSPSDSGLGPLLTLVGAALLAAAAGAILVMRHRGLLPWGHTRPPDPAGPP